MANQEHLEILKKGISVWNRLRRDTPAFSPDLSGANLGGHYLSDADLKNADLSGANLGHISLRNTDLNGANLSSANLVAAKLSNAHLSGANLGGAHLGGAHLNRANLAGAHMRGADLSSADLSQANLTRANLTGANLFAASLINSDLKRANLRGTDMRSAVLHATNLTRADLDNAVFHLTMLSDTDLSETKGLDTVRHYGPSTIGLDTFFKSKGKIPEIFLRGAGVPDIFIQYAASLAGMPFEFYSCFISHSSKDKKFVERLHADLQSNAVRCWYAPEDLKIGDKFRVEFDRAIRLHDKLLIVLSEHSVQSDWVEKEVETAFEKERNEKRLVLFPIRLDDAIKHVEAGWAADIRRTRQIGDFRNWKNHNVYAKAFERLLRDLKSDKARPDQG